MSKHWKSLAKWIWGVGILLAIGFVLWRSRTDIAEMLAQLPTWMLLSSFLPLLVAKMLLGENARIAAVKSGMDISYVDATRLYNLSQLGKYLPGSVWQFVGRAAAYRNLFSVGYGQIRDSLLTESLWIVAGASLCGAVLCGVPLWRFMVDKAPATLLWWLLALVLLGLTTAVALFFLKREQLLRYLASAIPTPRAVLVQMGIWAMLGLSFWILVHACGMRASLPFTIGLFAGGYALGFLVPFAPAGLGVRDAVLTVGLLPYAPAGEALAVTMVARVIYLAAELLIVAIQGPLFRLVAGLKQR